MTAPVSFTRSLCRIICNQR